MPGACAPCKLYLAPPLIKKNKKKSDEEEEEEKLIYGSAKVLLSDKQVLYAALDALLGFEIARSYWNLEGY
jgi:hypothetical protein